MDFEEYVAWSLLIGVPPIVLGEIGVGIGYGSNKAIVNKEYNKDMAKLEAAKTQLNQNYANKCDLSYFDISSIELAEHGKGFLLKAFGCASVEDLVGLKQNKYLNVFLDISSTDAFSILKAADKLDDLKRTPSYNTPEHNVTLNKTKGKDFWNPNENKKIRSAFNACQEVYDALNNAVIASQSAKVEAVSEASSMNNSISKAYRVMRPEIVTNVEGNMNGFFASGHVSSTFVNAGFMTTSVSQVFSDENKDLSYFYIDTLQAIPSGKNIDLVSCRALVSVKGAELSQEEVYAKFIKGEHESFEEVIREKQGSKIGVIDNQLVKDVEEIEFW